MSHEIHESCDSVTFREILVDENRYFLILPGIACYQIRTLIIFGEMYFLLMSEKALCNEVKCKGMASFWHFMVGA